MKDNLTFEFTIDKEQKTVNVKREYDAPLHLVWDAYTKRELLDQWWAPKPWKAKTKRMEFKTGGEWLYAMVGPENEEHWALAQFKQIEDEKRFTVKDAFCDSEGTINTQMPQAEWDVRFSEQGDTTLVEFHIVYPDVKQLEETLNMGFKEGLSKAMEGLDDVLEKMKK